MPLINNLEHQFSNLSTADTMTKDEEAATSSTSAPTLISPSKSEASAGSIFSASDDEASHEEEQDDHVNPMLLIKKTDHKLQEEQGMMADEPLLKVNPYRFVLFPIQDNDVRYDSCGCSLQKLLPMRTEPSTHTTAPHTSNFSFGKCTKRPKLPFGRPKRLIWAVT